MAKRRRRKKRKTGRRKRKGLKALLKLTRKRKKLLSQIGMAAGVLGVSFFLYAIPSMGGAGLIEGIKSFAEDPEGFIGRGAALSRVAGESRPVPVSKSSVAGSGKEIIPGIFKGVFREKPKLTFIIDDIGYTLENQPLLQKLGRRVTYSIMPLLPYSDVFDETAKRQGAEILLHLPMESVSEKFPGPGLITN
ncbi:MAG TPA: divergent polysaccharide deacetylase family protein, partial [Candidatus Omnitrophota bacterium]|nr:divergent polysaccharide deacetylase family protein [Candidatus Omnitrophota bacterium]